MTALTHRGKSVSVKLAPPQATGVKVSVTRRVISCFPRPCLLQATSFNLFPFDRFKQSPKVTFTEAPSLESPLD